MNTSVPSKIIFKVPYLYPAMAVQKGSRSPIKGYNVDSVIVRIPEVPRASVTKVMTIRITNKLMSNFEVGRGFTDQKFEQSVEIPYSIIDGRLYRPVSLTLDLTPRRYNRIYAETSREGREALESFVRSDFLRAEDAAVLFDEYAYEIAEGGVIPFMPLEIPSLSSLAVSSIRRLDDPEQYPRQVADRRVQFGAEARRRVADYRIVDGLLHVPTTGPGYFVSRLPRTPGTLVATIVPDVTRVHQYRIDVPTDFATNEFSIDCGNAEVRFDGESGFRSLTSGILPGSPALPTIRAIVRWILDERRPSGSCSSYAAVLSETGLMAVSRLMSLLEVGSADVDAFEEELATLRDAAQSVIDDIPFISYMGSSEAEGLQDIVRNVVQMTASAARLIECEKCLNPQKAPRI